MKKKYHRVGFTAAQRAELWDRWRKGESLKAIGREFGKPSSCIFAHIRPTGGTLLETSLFEQVLQALQVCRILVGH